MGNSVLPIKKNLFGGQCKWQAVARLCACSILLYSIRIQTNVFLLHKWIMMVLWIWQVRMTLQAKTIAGMLQYGELVVLGGGGVKICWMSTRCGEALDNSTGVFITTGFLWDSVPSKFESLVKKKTQLKPRTCPGACSELFTFDGRSRQQVSEANAGDTF